MSNQKKNKKQNFHLVSALKSVKRKLTKKTWNQGSYFAVKNNNLCMCVHGAGQSVVNPEIKKFTAAITARTARGSRQAAAAALATGAAGRAAAAAAANARAAEGATGAAGAHGAGVPGAVWNERPNWIKNSFILNGNNYGNLDLHYLMGMVGLTADFNDSKTTTLKMVKEKLDQAIQLAIQLGV